MAMNKLYTEEEVRLIIEGAIAEEREACALVCLMPVDEIQITGDCSEYVHKDYLDCAEAIRARGK
jgi:hypothetical protein